MSSVTLATLRSEMEELFEHRTGLYWFDMLASSGVGWACLSLAVRLEGWTPWHALLIVTAALAFLRAVLFIHEISHFRRGVLPGFTAVWNLIVGIPMMLPSFMYVGTHSDHHRRHLYGTIGDPEYLPLAHMSRGRVVRFVAEMPLVPILLLVRWGVLTPLSWLIPPLRRFVVGKLSALVINPDYTREPHRGQQAFWWIVMEVLLLSWVWSAFWMMSEGILPWKALAVWYLTATVTATVNQVRTLVAHHYENDGGEIDTTEQLVDSINLCGLPILTPLMFPVGLRYHALHHWLADMPYHSLGEAHRRILARVPEDAPYRKTVYTSMKPVVSRLWRTAAKADGKPAHWKKS